MPEISFEISIGTTLEEVKMRKKIIRDFYATWNAAKQHIQYCITAIEE